MEAGSFVIGLVLGGAAVYVGTTLLSMRGVGRSVLRMGDGYRRDDRAELEATSLVATLDAPRSAIVKAFGEPLDASEAGDPKTTVEWRFTGPDGAFVIYDRREAGRGGKTRWHVGGQRQSDVGAFLRWLGDTLSRANDIDCDTGLSCRAG